jgi:hypothetical protein
MNAVKSLFRTYAPFVGLGLIGGLFADAAEDEVARIVMFGVLLLCGLGWGVVVRRRERQASG